MYRALTSASRAPFACGGRRGGGEEGRRGGDKCLHNEEGLVGDTEVATVPRLVLIVSHFNISVNDIFPLEFKRYVHIPTNNYVRSYLV